MPKPFPLQTLLDLSQLRLEEATRQLGVLIAGEKEAAKRMAMLIEYRDEYQKRFLEAARTGIGKDQWGNYQAFLDKLESAIAQAGDMVAASRARTVVGQRAWIDKRGQVKTYDTLHDRHDVRLRYADQKKEQKLQDEHAARGHHQSEK
jgi:flagellar FliJ protein